LSFRILTESLQVIYFVILKLNFLRTFLGAIVRICVFVIQAPARVCSSFVYKHTPTGRQRATERRRSRRRQQAARFVETKGGGERRGVGSRSGGSCVAPRRVATFISVGPRSWRRVCRLSSRDSVASSLETVDHVFANIRGARAKRL